MNKIQEIIFLYKASLILSFTPTKWKESTVIWIPKPHKEDYKVYKAWRPISLTNYLVKALEKLLTWEVDTVLESNKLNANQHGFLANKSTETAISANVNYVEQHIMYGKPIVGVFLDIQAAFDTIAPEAKRDALDERGTSSIISNWYYNYITHQNVITTYNSDTATGTISTGFPQGGVCSAKF